MLISIRMWFKTSLKIYLTHTKGFVSNRIISGNLMLWIIGLALIVAILTWICLVSKKRRKFITERDHYLKTGDICLNMVSETMWITRGQGVHTAFLDAIDLLSGTPTIDHKSKWQRYRQHISFTYLRIILFLAGPEI